MSETEKLIQSYIDGLIDDLSKGYDCVYIHSVLKGLREIQDTANKELHRK